MGPFAKRGVDRMQARQDYRTMSRMQRPPLLLPHPGRSTWGVGAARPDPRPGHPERGGV